MYPLLNFLGFQTVWFSCVLGAAHGLPWLGPLSLSVFMVLNVKFSDRVCADIVLGLICLICGLVLDSSWSALGWLRFAGYHFEPLAPIWLLCLWFGFALTLNHSMAWMQGRYVLSAIAGAVFAPLSYYAGARLGAVQWLAPYPSVVALTLSWACFMPLVVYAAKRLQTLSLHTRPSNISAR